MGLVPDSLDSVYEGVEASKAPTGGGGGLLPEGEYTGVVLSAEVRPGMKPWVDAELSLKLQVTEPAEHAEKVTFCDIELAPNTDKEGNPSPGKLGFVKGQLEKLGYTGKLSEVEYQVNTFLGATVKFRQKVDDHLDENGNPDQYARINPNTGQPYIDREVYLNELVTPGAMGSVAVGTTTANPAVY